eukprot:SAG22_NODE_1468_length_4349_cov_2.069882_7_plen_125_part_01
MTHLLTGVPTCCPRGTQDTALLQTWARWIAGQEDQGHVVLCVAEEDADRGGSGELRTGFVNSPGPGGCAAYRAQGYQLVRNESVGWRAAGPGRVPLYSFHLPGGNQVGTMACKALPSLVSSPLYR